MNIFLKGGQRCRHENPPAWRAKANVHKTFEKPHERAKEKMLVKNGANVCLKQINVNTFTQSFKHPTPLCFSHTSQPLRAHTRGERKAEEAGVFKGLR